ncbi:methionine adenosyltransferase [Candidatus Saccharibacteria bacterium]|nr:methionine adenosyltransferase [Candidatus Saccharibacteria bacterium]
MSNFKFASESVAAGHPDKVADQISDAIVDAVLLQDTQGRTAVETLVAHDRIVLAGEVNTFAKLDIEQIVREQIKKLGYTNPDWGFSDQSPIDNYLHQQSNEIAVGVDDYGAGDQGIIFGYATNETEQYLPAPIAISHALVRALDTARETGRISYLRPDGKAQIALNYVDDKPVSAEHVTIAVPHSKEVDLDTVKQDIYKHIVVPVLANYGFEIDVEKLIVNGTGVWHNPGPSSDSGLTGRKIVVDSYGGFARVGGGAFSGKDPSKVDRSGAYAARFIAKNLVANGLAERAEVALAYYIGAKEPVNYTVETFGTARVSQVEIDKKARQILVPSVRNIIEQLDLHRPIYLPTASYGHFGRNEFPWERVIDVN